MTYTPRRRSRALATAIAACLLFCFVGTVYGSTPRTGVRKSVTRATAATHGVTEIRLVDMDETDPEAARNPVVFVTRTGVKYHRGGCRYLRLSCSPLRLSEARMLGYTPCSWCRPPD